MKERILILILPAFSCGIWMLASIARLTRASFLEILKKDYVTDRECQRGKVKV